ncbi:MAG TPA: molybdenum cofactor biosynthesis protein MoaE [Candidatus Acidoferrales bacterium]|nr:molybdenum cofactor biosynthesis protein MoaE [Candidatus Acidoferrales bacterium]
MRLFALSSDPLDEQVVTRLVSGKASGGIVTFVGRVRDHARGRTVVALEYEAYPEMAESVFAAIAQEAKTRFSVSEVAIHHRQGRLAVGDVSVVVAVAAAHRGPAFEACRYTIDELKKRAPIWKKEFSPDGAAWVEERP